MPGFDISSLVEFIPPTSRCWLCLALWQEAKVESFICPGCHSVYLSQMITISNTTTFTNSPESVFNLPPNPQSIWSPSYGPIYTDLGPGRKINIGSEPMAHAIDLARLAVELRDVSSDNPPLRVLMKLLSSSRSFIHVTSFNFDEFTLALLEMAAQSTSIAAIFSGVDPRRQNLFDQVITEAPGLEYRIEGTKADIGDQNHGKLIIIDGLLAVIGSPNLTRPAWRKAAANMEIVEVVTDISRVIDLNNRYFSPLWKRLQPNPETRYSVLGWTILTPEDPEHPDRRAGATDSAQDSGDCC